LYAEPFNNSIHPEYGRLEHSLKVLSESRLAAVRVLRMLDYIENLEAPSEQTKNKTQHDKCIPNTDARADGILSEMALRIRSLESSGRTAESVILKYKVERC
jgi:hypothetical protein